MKLTERKSCPYCKNTEFKTLFEKNYNSKELNNFLYDYYKNKEILKILNTNIYVIVECKNCKGLFQKFIPDNDLSYFLYEKLISAEDSFNKKKNINQTNFKEYNLDAKIIKCLINKNNNETKILEFGCGWGFWAKFMKELNFKVETVEISSARINHLNKNKIVNYKSISETNDKYDLIFSNQALEHINNPHDTLNELNERLVNGGIMFHKFPSTLFFKRKLSKKYIPKKDCAHPLEHINIINKKCFMKMCSLINLKPANVKNLDIVNSIKNFKNNILFNQAILKK